GNKTIKVDIRVIAATNRDLEKMINDGSFRLDLYYRLNIVPLTLSPLRERKDDLLALAKTFLDQFSREVGHELNLSPRVIRFFQEYNWPGNIRELQNVLEHASIVCGGGTIEIQHLPARMIPTDDNNMTLKDKPYAVREILARMEKELILSALDTYNNNRTKAMKALGFSRRVFYDKLIRYGID
ncbi:MAG: sigma 54-interacting transcriptional regulator, partial [Desulfosporosinus sp.]|nr:sigma 54-interacting transcriptional regulator [Desulfosporosinus sp.]